MKKTGRTIAIATGLLALIALLLTVAKLGTAQGTTLYLSPDGSDSNTGTLNSPWKTLAYALTKLSPGDTLYLRGGIYYETGISVSPRGTASAPITVRSYPGERAIWDGGSPKFRSAPNNEWELVNAAIGLYRSVATFSSGTYGAWLLDYDSQIVQYSNAANMEATYYGPVSGSTPLYMGPGLQWRSDGRIYIRLQPNPNDLTDSKGNAIAPTPIDPDPRQNRIAVFPYSGTLYKPSGATYLRLLDITMQSSGRLIDAAAGTTNIEIANSTLRFGTYGILPRDTSVSGWWLHDNDISGGFPPYVYWTDVKNSTEHYEAYPEFQSDAITGYASNWIIERNTIRDSLDGFHIKDGSSDIVVRNNLFTRMHDDSMEIWGGVNNVEVAHNIIWSAFAGIGTDGTSATRGSVYIHHNIFDTSRLLRGGRAGNYRASSWPVWTAGSTIENHSCGDCRGNWRFYSNTMVARKSGYSSHGLVEDVDPSSEKYVYNNLILSLDGRILYRDDSVSSGAHYDGTLFWRLGNTPYAPFYSFGDGGTYNTLATFQARNTGWEVNGLEVDPGLNITAIADETYPGWDALWERYRPTNPLAFTMGVDTSTLGWPEGGAAYRGALGPVGGTPLPTATRTPTRTPTRIPTTTPSPTATAIPPTATAVPPTATPTVGLAGTPTATPTFSSSAGSATTIAWQIDSGNDDAEESEGSGSMYLSSSDLELTTDGSIRQTVGMRFTGVTIPAGAVITNARIEFSADEQHTDTTDLAFFAQADDNPPTFGSASFNVSGRVKTLNSVIWRDIPVWTLNQKYETPDLSAVVQEVVNRPGWAAGNAMVFIVAGAGVRTADAFEGGATLAPKLTVTFIAEPNAPSPTYTPTPLPSPTSTNTPTPTVATGTPTATATATPTPTPPATATPTNTPAQTPTSMPAPDLIVADGFESGTLSSWSSATTNSGDLGVSAEAAFTGGGGMRAVLHDSISVYVTDDRPNGEARYRARFYFHPHSITMTSGDEHYIFYGYDLYPSSKGIMRVEFGFYSGNYQLRAYVLEHNGLWKKTGWFTISNAWHSIEVDWRAATAPGANDGGLTFWIDGLQSAELTGVDNDTLRIDRVKLGATSGVDSGTRGSHYFDAFESRRQTYIGQ